MTVVDLSRADVAREVIDGQLLECRPLLSKLREHLNDPKVSLPDLYVARRELELLISHYRLIEQMARFCLCPVAPLGVRDGPAATEGRSGYRGRRRRGVFRIADRKEPAPSPGRTSKGEGAGNEMSITDAEMALVLRAEGFVLTNSGAAECVLKCAEEEALPGLPARVALARPLLSLFGLSLAPRVLLVYAGKHPTYSLQQWCWEGPRSYEDEQLERDQALREIERAIAGGMPL